MSVMDSLMQSFFIWPLTCCLETRKCIFLYEFIFHVGLNCSTSFHNGNVLNWMGKIDHSSKVSQLLIYFTCFNQYVNNSVNLAFKICPEHHPPCPLSHLLQLSYVKYLYIQPNTKNLAIVIVIQGKRFSKMHEELPLLEYKVIWSLVLKQHPGLPL